MKVVKRIMRAIKRWWRRTKPVIRSYVTQAARVAEKVTEGQVAVTKDNEIILDEPTTKLAIRKIASVAIGLFGLALVVIPSEFKFTMMIGDGLLRLSTTMWEGDQWIVTT